MRCPRCDSVCATSGNQHVCLHCHWIEPEKGKKQAANPINAAVKKMPSELERTLDFHLRVSDGCGDWVTEYRFSPRRNWKADFAWPSLRLLVELEGGTRGKRGADGTVEAGRHNRHEGFEQDCVKYNEAAMLGYRLLRFTSDMVKDGRAIATIRKMVARLQEEQCAQNP